MNRDFSVESAAMTRMIFCLSILSVLLLITGCGPTQADQTESLKFFGMTYGNYEVIFKKPPAGWSDIEKLSEGEGLEDDRKLINQMKQMNYTIVWDAGGKSGLNREEVVLAYPADGKESGGQVLMLNGAVLKLTAAELVKKLDNPN